MKWTHDRSETLCLEVNELNWRSTKAKNTSRAQKHHNTWTLVSLVFVPLGIVFGFWNRETVEIDLGKILFYEKFLQQHSTSFTGTRKRPSICSIRIVWADEGKLESYGNLDVKINYNELCRPVTCENNTFSLSFPMCEVFEYTWTVDDFLQTYSQFIRCSRWPTVSSKNSVEKFGKQFRKQQNKNVFLQNRALCEPGCRIFLEKPKLNHTTCICC